MTKVDAPRICQKIIDEAIQIHGAHGVSQDSHLTDLYHHVRHVRLADGPDIVHLIPLPKRSLSECLLWWVYQSVAKTKMWRSSANLTILWKCQRSAHGSENGTSADRQRDEVSSVFAWYKATKCAWSWFGLAENQKVPDLVDDTNALSLGSSGEVPGRVQGGSRKVSFGGLWRNCISFWILSRLQEGFEERKVSDKVVADSSYYIFLHKVASRRTGPSELKFVSKILLSRQCITWAQNQLQASQADEAPIAQRHCPMLLPRARQHPKIWSHRFVIKIKVNCFPKSFPYCDEMQRKYW